MNIKSEKKLQHFNEALGILEIIEIYQWYIDSEETVIRRNLSRDFFIQNKMAS